MRGWAEASAGEGEDPHAPQRVWLCFPDAPGSGGEVDRAAGRGVQVRGTAARFLFYNRRGEIEKQRFCNATPACIILENKESLEWCFGTFP